MAKRLQMYRLVRALSVVVLAAGVLILPSSSLSAATAGSPWGYLDTATRVSGGLRVTGWAIDPNVSGSIEVHVYVDGTPYFIGAARANRPDVGAAHPQYGADHGFDAVVGAGSQVCAYGINVGRGTNMMLSCLTVPVDPLGKLDAVIPHGDGLRVQGWTIDPETSAPLGVHVYVDNRFVASGQASLHRADVGTNMAGYGAQHGYDLVVPNGFQVCTYGLNQGLGGNALLGCWRATPPAAGSDLMARDILTRVNDERAARGLPGFTWDENLAGGARSWAAEMSRSGMRHSAGAGPDYGENVQYITGASSGALHLNWMSSDAHRNNIVWPGYRSVGIGVFCGPDGVVWAVERFGNVDPAKQTPMGSPRDPIVHANAGGLAC